MGSAKGSKRRARTDGAVNESLAEGSTMLAVLRSEGKRGLMILPG